MQNTASLPADHFDAVLHRLPAAVDLDRLVRQTNALERKRELVSGTDLLRLAWPWRAALAALAACR